jgi:Glycosyl transferase family 2
MPPRGDVAVVIPAKNEADRIQATVTAAAGIPGADLVVVVDDGSRDGTAAVAERAGAIVLRHSRSRGKGAALETGAEAVRLLERNDHSQPHYLLFLDGDLAESAGCAGALVQPVRDGQADMTIAVFTDRVRAGGHGFVIGLSGAGIRRATGWAPAQPLNGQRCLTRAAFEAARPLAAGWGVETGLTIDLLRQGFRVTEVEVPMAHRATGTDWRAQLHRARQFAGVARALAVRDPRAQAARHALHRAEGARRPAPKGARRRTGLRSRGERGTSDPSDEGRRRL